jgi:hypothetical protein
MQQPAVSREDRPRYRLDPDIPPDNLDFVYHLDGIDWYKALVPDPYHRCRVQTYAFVRGDWVYRCACGAISSGPLFPSDPELYWMQKNARLDPAHTIYSDDYYPPRTSPVQAIKHRWKLRRTR